MPSGGHIPYFDIRCWHSLSSPIKPPQNIIHFLLYPLSGFSSPMVFFHPFLHYNRFMQMLQAAFSKSGYLHHRRAEAIDSNRARQIEPRHHKSFALFVSDWPHW
jgi:hypothetical protein